MTETWRPVPGFEGLYEVSDLGRVRSLDRAVTRGGNVHQLRGVILDTRRMRGNDPRRQVTLCRAGARTRVLVSHLVLSAFVGPRPAGLVACHGNGDKADDRPANLRWDTQSNNLYDAGRVHGTHRGRQRTHCPRRHPLRAPNLRPGDARHGWRACLACDRARSLLRSARHRGRDLQEVADECFAALTAGEVSRP